MSSAATCPGSSTLISRRGEVHVDAIGTRPLGGREPMRRDTIFRIASMTKPITAVAAMILVEECKLRLDEPVDRLLPELADRRVLKRLDGPLDDTVPAAPADHRARPADVPHGVRPVMAPPGTYPIQQAIDRGRPGPRAADPPPLAPDELMRRLGALPLMHQPGERWLYNSGFDVLGVLIARAAGQPLRGVPARADLRAARHDGHRLQRARGQTLDRLAGCYQADAATGRLLTTRDEQWGRPPASPPGGGTGLVSTVDDYLAFGQMMLNSGRYGGGAHPRAPVGRGHDDRPADAGAEGGLAVLPGFLDSHGWGFGVSVVTRRDGIAAVPGPVRLGRRFGHVLVLRPAGGPGRRS